MKIISWNVNSLRTSMDTLMQLIENENFPEIITLQETKCDQRYCKILLEPVLALGYTVVANTHSGYSGTITLIKDIDYSNSQFIPDESRYEVGDWTDTKYNQGRLASVNIGNLYVLGVYIPNSATGFARMDYKIKFIEALIEDIKATKTIDPTAKIIIAGDVNIAPEPKDVRNSKSNWNCTPGHTQTETDLYYKLLKELDLVDVNNHLHGDEPGMFTYWNSYRPSTRINNVGWRLDHFWISKNIKIIDYRILANYYSSDHCPILLEIDE